MANALLHFRDFQPGRRPLQPGASGLLFEAGMENIGHALELALEIPQRQQA
jgi:hypothetical protein